MLNIKVALYVNGKVEDCKMGPISSLTLIDLKKKVF
jgi:hypothetical protein